MHAFTQVHLAFTSSKFTSHLHVGSHLFCLLEIHIFRNVFQHIHKSKSRPKESQPNSKCPINELGTCGKRGRDEGVRAEGGPMMRGGMGDSRGMAGEREGMGRRRGTFTTMQRHIRIRLGGCNVLHWEWYVSVRSCYAIACNVHTPVLK